MKVIKDNHFKEIHIKLIVKIIVKNIMKLKKMLK